MVAEERRRSAELAVLLLLLTRGGGEFLCWAARGFGGGARCGQLALLACNLLLLLSALFLACLLAVVGVAWT